MNLYGLSGEYLRVIDELDAMEGDEPTESTIAMMEEIESNIKTKVDGYCSLIRHYQTVSTALEDELKRIDARRQAAANRAKWLKTRLLAAITAMGERQLKTTLNTVTIAKNGGKQPIQINTRPEELPEELRVVSYQPDTDAIRIRLEAGHEVPGCTLLTRGEHLRLA